MEGFWHRLTRLNARFIAKELRSIADALELAAPGPPAFGLVLFKSKEHSFMGQITVPDNSEPLAASPKFYDAEGAETTPDDVPAWTSSDEAVVTVTASEDGLSASVAVGAPGAAVVEVSTVEANTGETIRAQGTVTVTPGDTVLGSVEFTAPA